MMTNDDSIEAYAKECEEALKEIQEKLVTYKPPGMCTVTWDDVRWLVKLAMKYREVLQTISEQSYDEAEELAPDYAHEVLALTKKEIEDL